MNYSTRVLIAALFGTAHSLAGADTFSGASSFEVKPVGPRHVVAFPECSQERPTIFFSAQPGTPRIQHTTLEAVEAANMDAWIIEGDQSVARPMVATIRCGDYRKDEHGKLILYPYASVGARKDGIVLDRVECGKGEEYGIRVKPANVMFYGRRPDSYRVVARYKVSGPDVRIRIEADSQGNPIDRLGSVTLRVAQTCSPSV